MKVVALLCIVLALSAVSAAPHRLLRHLSAKADVDTDADTESGSVAAVIAEAEAAVSAEQRAEVETDTEMETETATEAEADAETETESDAEGGADHPAVAAARECRDSMPTDQSWETGVQFVDRTACGRCAALSVKQKCGGMWSPIQIACESMASGAEDWDLAFAWGGLKQLKLEALKPCAPGSGPVAPKMEVPAPKGWSEWLKATAKKAAAAKKA